MVSSTVSPSPRQARDLLPHLGPDLGVEPGGRLVEEQHLGLVDERQGDVESPLHAARVGAHEAVGGVGEPELLEQRVDPRSSSRPPSPNSWPWRRRFSRPVAWMSAPLLWATTPIASRTVGGLVEHVEPRHRRARPSRDARGW